MATLVTCAFTCGLSTLSEGFSQMESHWDLFFKFETLNEEITELAKDAVKFGPETLISDLMGQKWIDEMNEAERKFFEEHQ